ncbi:MAG: cofilin [Trizodia sp. TS-e1964]|nr:MAG: cofilin [Trizodia sp. TS-e1964]
MATSGVTVSPQCIEAFNELKLGKDKAVKYIIYKLSDDWKEIVIEVKGAESDYQDFYDKMVNAKSKDKSGKEGKGPRYAVYDFEYELPNGEGTRNRIAFISWSPDDAAVRPKMTYAASKEALKRTLQGVHVDCQASDIGDLEYESIIEKVKKGR